MNYAVGLDVRGIADLVHKVPHLNVSGVNSISMVFVLLLLLDGACTFEGLKCPFHIVFIHKLFGYLDGLVGQELFIVELLNWLVWGDLRLSGLF